MIENQVQCIYSKEEEICEIRKIFVLSRYSRLTDETCHFMRTQNRFKNRIDQGKKLSAYKSKRSKLIIYGSNECK